MRDGDQWLNVVLSALEEELAVELDAFAVGLGLIAVRIDSGPCDGEAVDGKAHLCEKADVFFKVMEHVDALSGRIEISFFKIEHLAMPTGDETAFRAIGYDIDVGKATAVQVKGTFALICCCGSAPKEVCGKRHMELLS